MSEFERTEAGNLTDEGIRQYLQARFKRITKIKDKRIAELEAQLEQHRWIPTSERLPEDDSPHLFWLESGNVIQGIPSCELGKHNPPLTHKATHWKPIILP